MGLCLTRDKDDYVKYDRYIYCRTCLAKIPYNEVYSMAHCANKSFVFVFLATMKSFGDIKNFPTEFIKYPRAAAAGAPHGLRRNPHADCEQPGGGAPARRGT